VTHFYPLDYDDNLKSSSKSTEKTSKSKDSKKSSSSALAQATQAAAAVNEDVRSAEEKRKHIKSIIDKIPTEKSDLFNYPLDWNEIDSTIEKKIRPWINKKIIEYIGEPEPTLVDFICSKVLAGSTPQGILDDVQMVRN
jgi:RNA-binding protein 25